MAQVQEWCVEQLGIRGVEAHKEIPIVGAYRRKNWDVAGIDAFGVPRVAISCKSILCDHTGAGPNRLDDLLGEASNLRRRYPDARLGYLVVVSRLDDSRQAQRRRTAGATVRSGLQEGDGFFRSFSAALASAQMADANWERLEGWHAICALQVDYAMVPLRGWTSSALHNPGSFFDALA